MKRAIPWAMVLLRVVLCPVLVVGAHLGWPGKALSLIILIALLDDIYDGILARRWSAETSLLRRADSHADTIFYLGVAAALYLRQPQLIRANRLGLILLFTLEVLRYALDSYKFGRAASYHSYLSKLWGLVLATAVIVVLSFAVHPWLIRLAIWLGLAADLEGLAISLILPRWQNDVRSIAVALRLRSRLRAEQQS